MKITALLKTTVIVGVAMGILLSPAVQAQEADMHKPIIITGPIDQSCDPTATSCN